MENVHTNSKGLGLLDRAELLPGVFLAASLTMGENGVCVTSIANTNEQDQVMTLLPVDLDIPNESESSLSLALSAVDASDSTLVRLRNLLRLQHLNGEERVSIVGICEEFYDIFHLPYDKLTRTSTIEHAIPTPNINPHRAINLRSYRSPRIHKEEVMRQTEKMLADGIIQHSFSPWNFPILVVPKNWSPPVRQNGEFL